ncbi:MAG: heavy metal-associated domain-containing protein [Bdellovibrionota bacterium]
MKFVIAIAALILPAVVWAGAQKYNVSVDGMTCGGCVGKVKEALTKIPGAEKVEVVLKKKTATFTVKEDRPELKAEIGKAIVDAGFTVTAINGKKVATEGAPAATEPSTETKKN